MMRWSLLTIVAISVSASLSGQEALTEVKKLAYGNPFGAANENFINMTNAMDDHSSVSLLLFDKWMELEAIGKDNELIVIDSANYHIEADKILFVQYGSMYELMPEKLEEAKIGDRSFVSLLYEEKKRIARGYFEIMVHGDFILLKRHDLEVEVTNSSPLGLPAAREQSIVRSEQLYYQTSRDKRPEMIPRKKSEFIKIFRRDRSDVTDYAKVNKLSLKRSEDVVSLFEYYNSLEE